jgi:hypothetical protein
MQKALTTYITLFVLISHSVAQTAQEWTQQKSTQKKYLLQQIAALHTYISYAKKGYDIVNKGVTTIRNIKKGDFNLHRDFFDHLKNVNPKISRYAKVGDIIAYQIRIIKKTKEAIAGIGTTKQFTAQEIDYCVAVYNNLLIECGKTIDELMLIITDGQLEMKEDERLKRINALYADMQNKYAFASSFGEDMAILTMQRMSEHVQINYSKILNGIK